jgi:Cdc6-like AAA superfamily ATPase
MNDDADGVFRPEYYSRFVIDPVTFVEANKLGFSQGNVVKYVCRWDAKEGVKDLRKALRYLNIMIEIAERAERIARGEKPEDVWKAIL